MKPTAPDTEARFQLTLVIRARYVGDTLAFLDKKTEHFDIHQVKELPRERNILRGSFKDAVKEILERGGLERAVLSTKLRALGFTSSSVSTTVGKLLRDKMLVLNKRTNIITLGKKEF